MAEQNFINIGIVKNQKGQVLIIKRCQPETGRDGTRLNWAFPGGHQDEGEDRLGGVEREILAETGYRVKALRQISLRMHPQFSVIICYFLCDLLEGQPVEEPKEKHEVEQIKWVAPQELKDYFTTDLDPKVAQELKINF